MTIHRTGLWLAIVALLMEAGALVVLLIPEQRTPSGGSVWSWYWPLANTLYFVGLLGAATAIVGAVLTLATSRSNPVGRSQLFATLGLAVLAIVVNRVVPYR